MNLLYNFFHPNLLIGKITLQSHKIVNKNLHFKGHHECVLHNDCSECCVVAIIEETFFFIFPALVVQLKLCKICFPFASLDTFKKHFYCNGNLKKHDQKLHKFIMNCFGKNGTFRSPPSHKIIHSKCNFMHFNCLRKLWFWSWEHLNFSIAISFYVKRNFPTFFLKIVQLQPNLFFL